MGKDKYPKINLNLGLLRRVKPLKRPFYLKIFAKSEVQDEENFHLY